MEDFDVPEKELRQSAPMFNVFAQNNSLVSRVGASQPAVIDDFDNIEHGVEDSDGESI